MINIVEVNYNTDIKTCIGILNKTSNTCFILFVQNMKNEATQIYSLNKKFEQANLNLNVINIEQFINAYNNSSILNKDNINYYISYIKQLYIETLNKNE